MFLKDACGGEDKGCICVLLLLKPPRWGGVFIELSPFPTLRTIQERWLNFALSPSRLMGMSHAKIDLPRPLLPTVMGGNVDDVEVVTEPGANANGLPGRSRSPLVLAPLAEHVGVAEVLLNRSVQLSVVLSPKSWHPQIRKCPSPLLVNGQRPGSGVSKSFACCYCRAVPRQSQRYGQPRLHPTHGGLRNSAPLCGSGAVAA